MSATTFAYILLTERKGVSSEEGKMRDMDDTSKANDINTEDDLPLYTQEEIAAAELDADSQARLEALLASPLFAGPDASIIAEVRDEEDPTQELASTMELEAKVQAIYSSIVVRAPEHKVQPSLERVQMALDLLGEPHKAYRAIHVTGTNGKTSTARMIEALLRESGLRTGRFTSPHLEDVRERICIDGQAISRTDFIATWEDVAPIIELVDAKSLSEGGPQMSFFEVFTVMAYAAFAAAPIDVAVVEVGMGGRWDATNVIDADVAVLTPIAIDHERWLGSSIAEIASEKVGIIKDGAHVVSAEQNEEAFEEILEACRQRHAYLNVYGRDMSVDDRELAVAGQMLTITTPAAQYRDVPLALKGSFQAENAALALRACEAFFGGRALSGDVVEAALMAVSSPGRLEVARTSPTVILDAAHNPHGAQATVNALREYYPGTLVAVVAMMADKDVEGFLGVLEPVFSHIVVTGMPSERAMDERELEEIAQDVFGEDRTHRRSHLDEAIAYASDLAEADTNEPMTYPAVVVLGSIQLVGMARKLLKRGLPDNA